MKKKKYGFTLIETIIALAFTVTILGIASSMFITGNRVFSNSDIKSTLQIEGQAIQEKISDVGMQATGIQELELDDNNQMNYMKIASYVYDEDGNAILHNFELNKEESNNSYKNGRKIYKLSIDGNVISNNVESIILDDNVISNASTLNNINSIEFNIKLKKEGVYGEVENSVNFRVTFRNK